MNLIQRWRAARKTQEQITAVEFVKKSLLPRHWNNAITAILGAPRHRKPKAAVRRRRPIHGPTFRYRTSQTAGRP